VIVSTTVRISEAAREALRDLSRQTGRSLSELLALAVERLRRDAILEETDAAFARLKADHAAWDEVLQERKEWDAALADGLEED